MDDNRNMLMFVATAAAILFGFQFFYEGPRLEVAAEKARIEREAKKEAYDEAVRNGTAKASDAPKTASSEPSLGFDLPVIKDMPKPREDVISNTARITFKTDSIEGSISLKGGRFDDVTLLKYKETMDENSLNVSLLSPSGTENTYYAEFSWLAAGNRKTPDANTLWTANKSELIAGGSVTLSWDNGEGLKFSRLIELDDDYMFTVTQRVENGAVGDVVMRPYGLISRGSIPNATAMIILHEGPLWTLDEGREEQDYSDLVDLAEDSDLKASERMVKGHSNAGGWIGFTDKFWLVSLIPDQNKAVDTRLFYNKAAMRYQTQFSNPTMTVPAGEIIENKVMLYVGALKDNIIEGYAEKYEIKLFDRAIDWGWLHFLTKPIFYLLNFFYGFVGNFGFAILLLTLTIKGALFPMANKQYASMGKMKLLQPQMKKLKDKYGDDKAKMQKATMELYKKEKVNPLASCMPLFIQMPIFFALYKVLYISIDMRHAPFILWIKDLSAPDPMLVTNLFGLIPWEPTGFLALGVLPILMGVTMWMQQKLSPQTGADPMQQKIFAMLPIVFTFILAGFAVGLVVYWTWNNILTIIQQWLIMNKLQKEKDQPSSSSQPSSPKKPPSVKKLSSSKKASASKKETSPPKKTSASKKKPSTKKKS